MDEIDLNRLSRALTAKRMETVEKRRKRFLAGAMEASQIDEDDWRLIVEMDEIAEENE